MSPIKQAAIIFSICLLGEIGSALSPFPVPGSVLSMVLLFVLLLTKVIKEDSVKDVTGFLLKNMAFFFIPSGVGIIEYIAVLKPVIIPFLVICIVSTFVTFGVTALTVQGVSALQSKIKGGTSHE